MTRIRISTFYIFVNLTQLRETKDKLSQKCKQYDLKGTILLATEGINGTVAGVPENLEAFVRYIRSDQRFKNIVEKVSYAETFPFRRMKVRLKKEIVTIGITRIDPTVDGGTYVKAGDWNELLLDPEVVVIDTRNRYEIEIGTFPGAINPEINSFREFPEWVLRNSELIKNKKVAMFCTGGIRCEKASAYMKTVGHGDIFHLEGGVLNYFEKIKNAENQWIGECFVFDDRVSVKHDLKTGSYDLCHACRNAITKQDKQSPSFVLGVSCPKCFFKTTEFRKSRFAERQKQIKLAAERSEPDLGKKKFNRRIG
ncbi:MAG: rhodanese-related sulfurtransferase [Pseudomonadota bacterium]|nr:rhodanese-related sulfurtransferase [Pseudomonadota bacterium]